MAPPTPAKPAAKKKLPPKKTFGLKTLFIGGLNVIGVAVAIYAAMWVVLGFKAKSALNLAMKHNTEMESVITLALNQYNTFDRSAARSLSTLNSKEFSKNVRAANTAKEEVVIQLQRLSQIATPPKSIPDWAGVKPSQYKALKEMIDDVGFRHEQAMKLFKKLTSERKTRMSTLGVGSLAASAGDVSLETVNKWSGAKAVKDTREALEALQESILTMNNGIRQKTLSSHGQMVGWLMGASPLVLLVFALVGFFLYRAAIKPVGSIAQSIATLLKTGKITIDGNKYPAKELLSLNQGISGLLGELKKRDTNLKSILSGLEDGVFFFDKDGKFSKEYSAATTKFFPDFTTFKSVFELYEKYTETKTAAAKQVMAMLWAKDIALRFVDISPLLPQQIVLKPRTLEETVVRLIYKELRDPKGELQKVFVIAKDVNVEIKAKRQNDDQNERVARIRMASADSRSFKDFCEESEELFVEAEKVYAKGSQDPETINDLKRIFHTLKGSLALYEFAQAAKGIHDLESNLAKIGSYGEKMSFQDIQDRFAEIRKSVDQLRKEISDILGLDAETKFIKVPRPKIKALTEAVEQKDIANVEKVLKSLDRYALSDVLAKYSRSIMVLGEKLGKYVELKFEPGAAELSYPEARKLNTALLHILRNCVDHGIEDEQTRVDRQKPPEGSIFLNTIRNDDQSLHLVVRDDGGGINAVKLSEKAVKNGLWTEEQASKATEQDKIDLIFAANLSTRDQVTETSGRGVGMDAVKAHLEQLGGSVKVSSELTKGSRFDIVIPYAAEPEPEPMPVAQPEVPMAPVADVIPLPVESGPAGEEPPAGDAPPAAAA
ncbi:MAG: Hpt domain-containing protein [Bdellovibrionales bacterium]|nr:Hpt domain-containing protein [Bdellovibrionales bacterium]